MTFRFHQEVEMLCTPRETKKDHDELVRLIGQTISDFTGNPTYLRDCRTGQFKGSVRPRRKCPNLYRIGTRGHSQT